MNMNMPSMNFAATTGGSRKNSRKASRKNSRKASRKAYRKASRKASRKNTRKSTRKATRKNTMMGGTSMNAKLPEMMGAPGAMPQAGGKTRAIGTRAEVMHGSAHHTSGGLTRKDLKYNKHGRIVSRKASAAGKKALKRLEKAGYKARKGTFKLFKKGSRKH